jgi:HEAT repeat protein
MQGPRKLVAVLVHDKYPLDLRVAAALTMVSMKPRGGKQVGLLGVEGDQENQGLIRALGELPPAERGQIVGKLVPQLVTEMNKAPPHAQPGQPPVPDPSYPYKDAAFALLTLDQGSLVADAASREKLEAALADWSMVNFSQRVDESSQLYGVEQVLKHLKSRGVQRLPDLMQPDADKIDLMARLVAELGDGQTNLRASERLVAIARETAADKWKEKKAPTLQAANDASKLKPTKEQFQAQLDQYQQEELTRVFGSLKKVGGAPAVDFLLEYAQDANRSAKLRAAALAALEGNLIRCQGSECDTRTTNNVETVMAIAASDSTPDDVRDQALRRLGEAPRKLVVGKLYDLFKSENWKVRWMAADMILRMSETKDLDEFMDRLSKVREGMAMTEFLQYGNLIREMKGTPKPEDLIDRFTAPNRAAPVRLSAFGYYFWYGTPQQLGKLAPFEQDKMKTPKCKEGAAGCEWRCTVGEGKQASDQEITTIGEFVRYCVEPAMAKRTKPDKPGNTPDQSGKEGGTTE